VLRRHLGPKFDRNLPSFLAKAIVERLRLSKWRIRQIRRTRLSVLRRGRTGDARRAPEIERSCRPLPVIRLAGVFGF
jgi:hypothetical protein